VAVVAGDGDGVLCAAEPAHAERAGQAKGARLLPRHRLRTHQLSSTALAFSIVVDVIVVVVVVVVIVVAVAVDSGNAEGYRELTRSPRGQGVIFLEN